MAMLDDNPLVNADATSCTSTATTAGRNPVLSAPTMRAANITGRSEEHTSELQSLMRISYAVFCLKKKNIDQTLFKKNTTRLTHTALTTTGVYTQSKDYTSTIQS